MGENMSWSKYIDENYEDEFCTFVDRDEILKIIKNKYNFLLKKSEYFNVVNIFGIGGIGKSRLIKKIIDELKIIDNTPICFYINMEIMNSSEMFENLIKLRKQINKKCYYFDYAILLLWDELRIDKENIEFMNLIKTEFLDLINIADSYIPYTPGIENIINIINKFLPQIYNKFFLDENIFQIIKKKRQQSLQKLYEFLPHLLGLDIRNISNTKKIITFFDSYEAYVIDHDDWLEELLGTIKAGLHIIASRERLDWEDNGYLYIYIIWKKFLVKRRNLH
ncbi:MAG: hypothetical protein HFE49_05930 [Clostridia bacterium]|nr:hypothetical protein [Clostridia bacterium]